MTGAFIEFLVGRFFLRFGCLPVRAKIRFSRTGNDVVKKFGEGFGHDPFHQLLDFCARWRGASTTSSSWTDMTR